MKICSICKKELDESMFNKNKTKKDGLNNFCKKCNSIAGIKWYQKNKQKVLNKNIIRRIELREFILSIKCKLKCEKCEESDIACLDFHHENSNGKEYGISIMINRGFSKERILKEIEKCIVLCSNCHRKLHYNKNHLGVL